MDLSQITQHLKEHMPVYAEGPGGLEGASETHIGNVDGLEGDQYLKLTKNSSPDREHHWLPLAWIRTIDDRAVYLNKTIDEVAAELMIER